MCPPSPLPSFPRMRLPGCVNRASLTGFFPLEAWMRLGFSILAAGAPRNNSRGGSNALDPNVFHRYRPDRQGSATQACFQRPLRRGDAIAQRPEDCLKKRFQRRQAGAYNGDVDFGNRPVRDRRQIPCYVNVVVERLQPDGAEDRDKVDAIPVSKSAEDLIT